MIVNPYSIVAAFLSALEAALGAATLCLALAALRRRRGAGESGDDRLHLLFLLAWALVGLAAVAWPVLYLTLQSYVARWPGVMCIQGVTRVGTGSEGPAAYLPGLLRGLEILRPAVVFAAGAWLCLHLANRRTRTAPFTGRVLATLAAIGVLAFGAGALEIAYLVVPKQERFLSDGCCTVASRRPAPEFRPFLTWFGEDGEKAAATIVFFAVGLLLVASIAWMLLRPGGPTARRRTLLATAVAGLLFVPLAAGFATEVASPVLLGMPHHRCAWCLAAAMPETIVGAALLACGVLSVAWAAFSACAARSVDEPDAGARSVRNLLRAGLFGYAGALVFSAVELLLA